MRKFSALLIGLTVAAFSASTFAATPLHSHSLQAKAGKSGHAKKASHKTHSAKKHAKKA